MKYTVESESVVGDTYVAENAAISKVKNYADCSLYAKGGYEKSLMEFIMKSTYLDKFNDGYKDLIADIKRQRMSSSLIKMLESENTNICVNEVPMPRAFKAFVAKDLKGNKQDLKLFIDATGIINITGSRYTYPIAQLQTMMSYLLAGMNSMIYYVRPEKIINNTTIIREGGTCFANLVFYLIDYLRLSADSQTRGRIMYLAAKYYLVNILNKPDSDTVENWALRISGISSNEVDLINLRIPTVKDPNVSIVTFVKALSEYLKSPKLTIDVFVDKWMYLFGNGTQFGMELYPAFANILIYAYVGAYLNNQKTIEKITGRNMVTFVTEVIKVGSELI